MVSGIYVCSIPSPVDATAAPVRMAQISISVCGSGAAHVRSGRSYPMSLTKSLAVVPTGLTLQDSMQRRPQVLDIAP